MNEFNLTHFVALVAHFLQRNRGALLSLVQTILRPSLFFFSVSRRPSDPNFGHFPNKKKKKANDVFKKFLCRTGVSVVDPFSHAVLILPQHPPTFPPYCCLPGYQASDSENAYDFFFSFFFFQSDRPTQYQETHSTVNKKKGDGLTSLYLSKHITETGVNQTRLPHNLMDNPITSRIA